MTPPDKAQTSFMGFGIIQSSQNILPSQIQCNCAASSRKLL